MVLAKHAFDVLPLMQVSNTPVVGDISLCTMLLAVAMAMHSLVACQGLSGPAWYTYTIHGNHPGYVHHCCIDSLQ